MSGSPSLQASPLSSSIDDALYRAAFDTAFGLAILVRPDGAILDANGRAVALLEVRRDRLPGASLVEMGPWRGDPEWARWLHGAIATATAGIAVRADRALHAGSGEVVLDLSLQPIRTSAGTLVLIEGHDVTDRRRIEDALRSSEARFAGIVSLATDAVVSVDANYRIVLFNNGAERIFGYPAGEVVGQPLDILIPDRLRDRHRGHLTAFSASPVGGRRMGERSSIFGRRKSGEVFPAEASISKIDVGASRYFTAVLRDVSDQVAAEAERERLLSHAERARTMAEVARARAEEAEHRARFLADASIVLGSSLDHEETLRAVARLVVPRMASFVIIDAIDDHGVVQRLDVVHGDQSKLESARRLKDLPIDRRKTYSTRRAFETLRADYIPEVTAERLAAWAQSAEHLELLRTLAPTSFIAVPLSARGRALGAIGLALDDAAGRRYSPEDVRDAEELARRVALAVDNARLYEVAQRATRLRNEILGIVSHDLRNPLSVMTMCGSTLLAGAGAGNEESAKVGETILDAARWMERLVGDLLDIASIDAGKLSVERRPHDPVIIAAKSAIVFERAAAERGVRLEVRTPDSLGSLDVDEERLVQALSNLVGNAIKFTETGGNVRIEATERDGEVLFAVRDTGRGIAPDRLTRVFERFWQARDGAQTRGAGLGLSIAKGIVEAHGGCITVESELGAGTTFIVTLPRPTAPQTTAPA